MASGTNLHSRYHPDYSPKRISHRTPISPSPVTGAAESHYWFPLARPTRESDRKFLLRRLPPTAGSLGHSEKSEFSVCVFLWQAEGSRTPTAPQRFFYLYFSLSSLPCTSKAASSAQKSKAKLLAVGCCAVFAAPLFGKTRKIPKGISVDIFEGFSAVLAESCLRKPIGVQLPSA